MGAEQSPVARSQQKSVEAPKSRLEINSEKLLYKIVEKHFPKAWKKKGAVVTAEDIRAFIGTLPTLIERDLEKRIGNLEGGKERKQLTRGKQQIKKADELLALRKRIRTNENIREKAQMLQNTAEHRVALKSLKGVIEDDKVTYKEIARGIQSIETVLLKYVRRARHAVTMIPKMEGELKAWIRTEVERKTKKPLPLEEEEEIKPVAEAQQEVAVVGPAENDPLRVLRRTIAFRNFEEVLDKLTNANALRMTSGATILKEFDASFDTFLEAGGDTRDLAQLLLETGMNDRDLFLPPTFNKSEQFATLRSKLQHRINLAIQGGEDLENIFELAPDYIRDIAKTEQDTRLHQVLYVCRERLTRIADTLKAKDIDK